jgi:hypothetical protein
VTATSPLSIHEDARLEAIVWQGQELSEHMEAKHAVLIFVKSGRTLGHRMPGENLQKILHRPLQKTDRSVYLRHE